jgi:hypothetical protein
MLGLLLMLFVLAGCGGAEDGGPEGESTLAAVQTTETPVVEEATPVVPQVDLSLVEEDVVVAPQPLRAAFPFTVTATIHNHAESDAVDVPVMFHISAKQEHIGYTPFLKVLTVTVPASLSLSVEVPVNWNFAGGEHLLWVQVNRLPDAWQADMSTQPESEIGDNIVLLDLMVDPFDAYASDLCPGRVDVEIGPADVLPEPERQRVLVRLHNVGNSALYNLPVVVMGDQLSGVTYTPAIPPCGGITEVYVEVDRPFQQGESLTIQVNPEGWESRLQEDDFENNQVSVAAGLAPGVSLPPVSVLEDYDFSISTTDIEIPQMWIVLVTGHNQGVRDAADVPIRVENEKGRALTDAIPLIQGEGSGVVAFPIGYLWIPGGTITFTINPEDAKGSYPETRRDNNVATFTLP